MNGRFSFGRVTAVTMGAAAVAVLAASVALVTPAAAAPASCSGISFTVLHNDQSGGVILPGGSYTVSSPNLGCLTASNYFTTFLNRYNLAIPGWTGVAIRPGLGNIHQERQQHAIYRQVEQGEARYHE